jgi:hypothetical protein
MYNSVMQGQEPTLAQWQTFWTIPLIFAVVVTVMFAFGFREKLAPQDGVLITE